MKEIGNLRATAAKRSLGMMSQDLAAKLAVIAKMLAEAASDDLAARFRIGQEIARVQQAPEKYGKRAVTLLAAALGRKSSSLYAYAAVASAWRPEEVKALASRRNRFGLGLTFSHLLVLASTKKSERDIWSQRAISEGWSSRELRAQLLQARRGPRIADVPTKLAALSVVRLPMVREFLIPGRGLRDEHRPDLLKAIDAQERLAAVAHENAAALREAIAAMDSPVKLSVLAG